MRLTFSYTGLDPIRMRSDLCSYLAKVHLIEHHLVWVADAPETGDECQNCNHGESKLVVPFPLYCLFRNAFKLVDRIFCVDDRGGFCVSRAALPPSLAHSIGSHVVGGLELVTALLVKEGELKEGQESGRRPQRSVAVRRYGHGCVAPPAGNVPWK